MAEPSKIPLTVGFANIAGPALGTMAMADFAALSPLFARSNFPPAGKIPKTPILFLYALLNEDGSLQGLNTGIRQIAQATGAKMLVIASEIPSGSILMNAMKFPGPKIANIIFTNNRNGAGFSRFFKEMFKLMRDGAQMMEAYVRLSPQGGQQEAWLPGTLCVAEAGKLALPPMPAA
jgi:hypothetical protein